MSHGPASSGGRPTRPRGGPGRGGPMAGMMKGDKPKDFKGAMKKLIGYLDRYKTIIIIALIIAIASTAANIVGPKILGNATTKLFEGLLAVVSGTGEVDFDAIGIIILTVLALYVTSAIFSYIQGWIMARVSTDISYRLRKDISEKINRMELLLIFSDMSFLSLYEMSVDTLAIIHPWM